MLRRQTIARSLLPAYAVGILAMLAYSSFLHTEERHWIARDRLTEITPEAPAASRYEYKVTQVVKEEVLTLWRSVW